MSFILHHSQARDKKKFLLSVVSQPGFFSNVVDSCTESVIQNKVYKSRIKSP